MGWKTLHTQDYNNKHVDIVIERDNVKFFDILGDFLQVYDQKAWEDLYGRGWILLTRQGTSIDKDTPLKKGETIHLVIKQEAEPEVCTDIKTIYEDEDLLIVDKPANLPVHPSGRYHGNTLINLLQQDKGKLYLANRLDKDTTGIVVFSKNEYAARHLGKQFINRYIDKTYMGIVEGIIEHEQTIEAPIKESSYQGVIKQMVVHHEGKPSKTRIIPLQKLKNHTVLEIEPISGRTHQIRVHLKHIGHPIVYDRLYGSQIYIKVADRTIGTPPQGRQLLHCKTMTITHPKTREKLTITAELPQDMREFIQASRV